MTDKKRQEMKEYKEKAIACEHKLKGKRVSLDSGVMITSTELQKLENYESPTIVLKEPICYDINNIKNNTAQSSIDSESYASPETPTFISEKEEKNSNDNSSNNKSIMSEDIGVIDNSCDTLIPNQESICNLTVVNLSIHDENNFNDNVPDKESISIKSENISLSENSCNTMIPIQEATPTLPITNINSYSEDKKIAEQIPRLRSNSYTLSSPSPIMVAFLNSQVQQQLIEPKSLENNVNYIKECKSEPPSIYVEKECDDKTFISKSISLNSVPKSFNNQELMHRLKYRQSSINESTDNKTIPDQKQVERESVTTIDTDLSNDDSLVGSVINVFNGNSYENNSSPSSITCSKSIKHCCCRHSDDEYSLSSNNINYKTPEELNQEVERLRIEKLNIEKRHQAELSNLIKKQREEQEQIAVKYYLVTQSTSSGISLDNSECSESISKELKTSSSIKSEMTVINDKSILSDTSSIISSCSINKSLVCSSPRQRTPSSSPFLRQNIKFFHRIRGGLVARWTKAPTEVENSASTVINAGIRGYLTRRLLRTEKAQLLKKTILDSLKTALIMHMELKKQKPTESDLELHRRIINQVFIF